ncbi:hypothetical protein VNX24_09075 [Citrobacter farmeri]|uniref:hypothetical protein n=1 Tax=Citrobacter farmeri TaxID=67824 RepID=UPI002DB55C06|nr:hypothetical protein [Citrobacter farmeri]MEC3930109.1 hypothetical protein [Citrobacter farmeri]
MTDKQALREELSNPAIGSNANLRKLALALLDELEATYSRIGELEVIATDYGMKFQRAQDALKHQALIHKSQLEAAEKRIAEPSGQKRLIGWRASDYTDETSDPELAKNWAAAIGVLPIFEGDVNTKLSAAGIGKGE